MKKVFIIGLLLGGIIFGTSVYAVSNYLYQAKEVSYTPSDTTWNVSDVDSAIKDLYDKAKNYMPIPTGTKSITSNGNNIDVKNYAKVNVNVPSTGVFYLGTGTSFNIKQMSETEGNALYGIDWSNLTNDNFIITNLTGQTQYNTSGSGLNPAWSGHPAYVNFNAATKSYNQSTGILTVNNAYAYGYVAGGASWSVSANIPSTIYLVLGNIISVN